MRFVIGFACAVTALFAGSYLLAAEARPAVVPSFERFHARGEQPDVGGQLLLGELNCTSCHAAENARVSNKQAPILDAVGQRVRPEYIRDFLNSPHSIKPGTTMPDPFAGWEAGEKKTAVEAITHFLAMTGVPGEQRIPAGAIAKGDDLFHRIGCVACHDAQRPN